ncbi:hypothetical protein S7711_00065 [Stachybotrys chartarum IBT 7711]|uniref:Amine oxidase domain-containing protein n=1 Tax=Stachybotrys chartarum (strain CBS 109288 / IBT 7711) TaxID=1280523 RepID=A0A084B3B9_STACB|nr:hypothetical protein S7711_00065 [Stachybotrys chartarum IBT 7711]
MPLQHGPNGSHQNPHIAVIGAGFAGLRCADILLQHGFKVTIIEGRDRVGGRVHQSQLKNGRLVDLGPNWIHGTAENPMMDLAKQTDTPVGNPDIASYLIDESGNRLQQDVGEKYADMMWDIVQDAFKHSNQNSADIGVGESLHDFFRLKVEEKIPESEPDHKENRKLVMQLSEQWGAFVGSPIERQSLKFFWLEECIEGENVFCAGTYKNILNKVAQPAIAGADIIYNTKVSKISYRITANDKVKVEVEGQARTALFDEVVMTAPLGWLKRNLEAFEPPLPARLTEAIASLGYGCLEKVYINFPKAFWHSGEEDGKLINGFVQWLSPTYAPESNPHKWNQEVVELASLDGECAQPTLLFYVYGDQSVHLTDHAAKLASDEERTAFLLDYFKPYYSRLPNYTDESPDCQPSDFVATAWRRDELAGFGSYTNFQVGLEEGDEDVKTLRHGVPEQGLWLAGEHTAPFVALGTSTGAYWSGEAVGRRIAEAYGRSR